MRPEKSSHVCPRRCRNLALLVCSLAFLLCAATPDASLAAKPRVTANVISPIDQSVVLRKFTVRTRVHSPHGRYRIRHFLNGKLRAHRHGKRTRSKLWNVQLTAATVGAQVLRTVVESRGHRSVSRRRLRALSPLALIPIVDEGSELPNLEGSTLRIFEDFSRPAPLGSMGSYSDPEKIVYTGATGTKWVTYPQTYLDTYQKRPYRSDCVLSVHDGTLDYFLHSVDGQPAAANPSPVFENGSQYQTFGRYSARMRVEDTDLSEYYIAWLLWPQDESAWASAESDFPECSLEAGRNGVTAFSHYGAGMQETFSDPSFDIHEWHVYTQDWVPGLRRYYVDGKLIGATRTPIYSGPERWQLQVETKGSGEHSGHLLVDWVAIYGL